jgi:hypothetical protein
MKKSASAFIPGGCNFIFGVNAQKGEKYDIIRGGLGRGRDMTRADEELVRKATDEFEAKLWAKVDEFRVVDEKQELDIDRIDMMWSAARKAEDEVLKKVYTELTSTAGERDLIKKKARVKQARDRNAGQGKTNPVHTNDKRAVGNKTDGIAADRRVSEEGKGSA